MPTQPIRLWGPLLLTAVVASGATGCSLVQDVTNRGKSVIGAPEYHSLTQATFAKTVRSATAKTIAAKHTLTVTGTNPTTFTITSNGADAVSNYIGTLADGGQKYDLVRTVREGLFAAAPHLGVSGLQQVSPLAQAPKTIDRMTLLTTNTRVLAAQAALSATYLVGTVETLDYQGTDGIGAGRTHHYRVTAKDLSGTPVVTDYWLTADHQIRKVQRGNTTLVSEPLAEQVPINPPR